MVSLINQEVSVKCYKDVQLFMVAGCEGERNMNYRSEPKNMKKKKKKPPHSEVKRNQNKNTSLTQNENKKSNKDGEWRREERWETLP